MFRAAPLVRAKVIFTVNFPVGERLRLTAYGESDCEFDFDSHEWSCTQRVNSEDKAQKRTGSIDDIKDLGLAI